MRDLEKMQLIRRMPGNYDGKTYRMEFPIRIPEKVERDRKIDRYDRGMNRPWLIVRALKRLLPG